MEGPIKVLITLAFIGTGSLIASVVVGLYKLITWIF